VDAGAELLVDVDLRLVFKLDSDRKTLMRQISRPATRAYLGSLYIAG
jgi:hypothetical protein